MSTKKYIFFNLATMMSIFTCSAADFGLEPVIHFRTKHGDTLLHAAVKSLNSEALGSFLDLGCPTEAVDRDGRTALWLATEHGEVRMMRVLAKYGANFAVRHGVFVETLLHAAASHGHDLAVYYLLDNGFDTEVRDVAGWTALHTATVFNQETTVRLLVARGADVNARDKHGETPLHKAVRLGLTRIAKRLIELGADIHSKDEQGETPMYWVSKSKFSLAQRSG